MRPGLQMMLLLLHLLSKNELSLPSFSAKAAAAAGCEKAASSPLTILCYSTRAPRLSNTLFLCFNRLLLPSPRNNACLSVCIFPGFFYLNINVRTTRTVKHIGVLANPFVGHPLGTQDYGTASVEHGHV